MAGLDGNVLMAGFLVSLIGTALFMYGKKQSRVPHMAAGVLLVVFPYFVPSVVLVFGIAAVLLVLLWVLVRAGL
jgi:hypothetical protein